MNTTCGESSHVNHTHLFGLSTKRGTFNLVLLPPGPENWHESIRAPGIAWARMSGDVNVCDVQAHQRCTSSFLLPPTSATHIAQQCALRALQAASCSETSCLASSCLAASWWAARCKLQAARKRAAWLAACWHWHESLAHLRLRRDPRAIVSAGARGGKRARRAEMSRSGGWRWSTAAYAQWQDTIHTTESPVNCSRACPLVHACACGDQRVVVRVPTPPSLAIVNGERFAQLGAGAMEAAGMQQGRWQPAKCASCASQLCSLSSSEHQPRLLHGCTWNN